ncbi:hypothetical protein QTH09_16710, partial [Clostridium perfringens]|nr:hypothetical protein [Clostridium perfringens]
MNRKKIASLILATSIVTTQVATPVFASTNDNTTNVVSSEKVSDVDSAKDDSSQVSNNKSEEKDSDQKTNAEESAKDDSSQLVNSVDESNEKDTKTSETKTVTDSTTTAVVNNTTEFMSALKNNNIKSIKLNSDVILTQDTNIRRNIDIYGNNHTLDFSQSRIYSSDVIKISFNDMALTNGRMDNYGCMNFTGLNNEVTLNNITFNGPQLLENPNGIVNLKGNCKFISNSIQEIIYCASINIYDNANIYAKNTYNPSHWDNCSVFSPTYGNLDAGLTVGNDVNLTIISENNSACFGSGHLQNNTCFLKVGERSNVIFRNESIKKMPWSIGIYNITQMDLADTSSLEVTAQNAWEAAYVPTKFTWNLNNAHVKLSTNDTTYGVFAASNGAINFGSSTNLQDVSVWTKDNNFEFPNAVANDIYGTLNIYGSSISSANISNPNLTSSLVDNSRNGMSKLEFGVGKVDKSQLEDLLTNKQDTTGMTPESAKKYEDALAAGQKVFDNPKATQQQVNDAVNAIEDSLSALKPDKSGLQSAIDKAKDTLANGNLTPESQQALQDAINKAEGVLNNPDATVTDISGAIKDLETATNDVVSSADKTELEKLLNEKVDTSGMTADSIKDYEDALALGQQIFDNPNATQQEVNDAINAIKGCKDALKPDKSGLQSAIDKAKDTLANGNLTPDSQQALQNAINKAEGVLNNSNATLDDVNSAINDLEAATNGAVTSADKAKLEELLNNKKDTAGMTPESAKKYEDALAAGQKVFDNPNATQQEVNDAVKAIEDSSNALTPDKSGLQSAIEKATDALINGNLTPNSQQALKDAINNAKNVLKNPNATVADINSAIKDLEAATNGAVTSADKAKLEELLNNKKDTAGMTPESAKKYEDALAAGQKVFNNPNATQQEVDDSVNAIEGSLSTLKPDKSGLQSAIDKAKDTLANGNLTPES